MMTFRRLAFIIIVLIIAIGGFIISGSSNSQVALAEGSVVIGTGTPESCQSVAAVNALSNAVAAGGVIDFDCGPESINIVVNTNITDQNVTINGNNLIFLDGEQLRQIFYVQSGGSLILNHVGMIYGSATQGGAIYTEPSTTVVMNDGYLGASFSTGNGASIYNQGFLTLNEAVIVTNKAGGDGGAIFNNGGQVIINDSFVTYNEAKNGDSLYSQNGHLTVERTVFYAATASDEGGAIFADGPTQITNSSILDNQALKGGGLFLKNDVNILNTTIYRNRANLGGGIWKEASSNAYLKNSIVSNSFNTTGGSTLNCDGLSLTSQGRNIISDGTCLPNPGVGGDLFDTDPQLISWDGALDWGYMPSPGSPAIDYGLGCPPIDQRGYPRPLGQGCDVGSLEFGGMVYMPGVLR
jgi:hypothetical protein